MWYFAWVLGLGVAALAGILMALWFELKAVREASENGGGGGEGAGGPEGTILDPPAPDKALPNAPPR